MDAECGKSSNDSSNLNILDLPPEIVLEIFRYIDFRTLFQSVILTCKDFHDILGNDDIWKTLFALKWKEDDIVNDLNFIKDNKDVCFCYEDIDKYWKRRDDKNLRLVKCKMEGHYAPVDDVHIMPGGKFCVSGSRDRCAIVWNLSSFLPDDWNGETPKNEALQGHEGWVWSVDSHENKPNVVVTGSWDQTIKEWDLNHDFRYTGNHRYHPAAILGLCCHDNVYTTACYDRIVRTYDPRSQQTVLESKHHKKAVLCVQVTDKYILSGSDDQTIGVYDIRGGSLLTSIHVDSPVLCMNLAESQGFNYLRAGGRNGSMYIFDTSGEKFTLLNSMQLWNSSDKVNELCNYRGAVVACSQSGSINMYTPDRNFGLLEKFDVHTGDVTAAHSRDGILASGSCDNSVIVWKFR